MSLCVLTDKPEHGQLADAFKAAAEHVEMGFDAITGEFEELMATVSAWTILPEILVIDMPEGMDAATVLERVAQSAPEGEAQVILSGTPNDISVYRSLKAMGVVEAFSDIPSKEDAIQTLDEISKLSLTRSGIDPRRAVYVWSSCGGAGGTSIALSFARHYANEGCRTLFIDMDFSTAPGSFMLAADKGGRETPGLLEAISNPGRVDALFLERTIEGAGKNLFFLSARQRNGDDAASPSGLTALVSRAQQNFDMVVVDIPWRGSIAPEMGELHGSSYIVAAPSPAGLLGFSLLAKSIMSTAGKLPLFGILNKTGEFSGADIDAAAFKGGFKGEFLPVPYDRTAGGKLFFEQKTMLDAGPKVRRALKKALATLPAVAGGTTQGADKRRTKVRSGFLRIPVFKR
jgi:pilus assembly protein CpaE